MKNEDKEVAWEQRKKELDEEREIRSAFTTNIGQDADKFLAILSGNYQAPRLPTDSDRIFKKSDNQPVAKSSKLASLYDNLPDEDEEPQTEEVQKTSSFIPKQVNKYAEFTEQLDRFPMIKDQDKRKEVIAAVIGAIRVALNDQIIKEVASNTKKAFTSHCKQIYKTAGGLKVIFNFDGNDIQVIAKGVFYGDETICVHNKDGKTIPAVIKVVGESYVDLTKQFSLSIG